MVDDPPAHSFPGKNPENSKHSVVRQEISQFHSELGSLCWWQRKRAKRTLEASAALGRSWGASPLREGAGCTVLPILWYSLLSSWAQGKTEEILVRAEPLPPYHHSQDPGPEEPCQGPTLSQVYTDQAWIRAGQVSRPERARAEKYCKLGHCLPSLIVFPE